MLKTIIIEDEVTSQNLLSTILQNYCPSIELSGIANSLRNGVDLIETVKPDLVFLDVELGNDSAFDLLDQVKNKNFKIVLTTAHGEYALKAFKYEATDYILKPYTPKDIIKAIERVKTIFEETNIFCTLVKSRYFAKYSTPFLPIASRL
jgi:two-component system LytT family response regulator